MPGTTKEITNRGDFPLKNPLSGNEIVPGVDSQGQAVGIPVSALVQDGGVSSGHILDKGNPHEVTAAQVGLGDIKSRRVASIWATIWTDVTFPDGTETVLQRSSSGVSIWAVLTTPPSPVDPLIHQKDASNTWWLKTFDSNQIDDAVAAEAAAREADVEAINDALAAEAASRGEADTALGEALAETSEDVADLGLRLGSLASAIGLEKPSVVDRLVATGLYGIYFDTTEPGTIYSDYAATVPAADGSQLKALKNKMKPDGTLDGLSTTGVAPIVMRDAEGKQYLDYNGLDDRTRFDWTPADGNERLTLLFAAEVVSWVPGASGSIVGNSNQYNFPWLRINEYALDSNGEYLPTINFDVDDSSLFLAYPPDMRSGKQLFGYIRDPNAGFLHSLYHNGLTGERTNTDLFPLPDKLTFSNESTPFHIAQRRLAGGTSKDDRETKMKVYGMLAVQGVLATDLFNDCAKALSIAMGKPIDGPLSRLEYQADQAAIAAALEEI